MTQLATALIICHVLMVAAAGGGEGTTLALAAGTAELTAPENPEALGMAKQQKCTGTAGTRGQDEPLALGEKVKVHVNVMGTRLFTHISFDLRCPSDSKKTTSIMIWRLSPTDATIRWTAYWNGYEPPSDPNLPSVDSSEPWPQEQFPEGQHTFVLERRPAAGGVAEHLALWLEARPDRVAKVRLQEGCDRLRTTTFLGSLSPKFYSAEGVCGHQNMSLPAGSKVRVGVHVLKTDLGFKLALGRPGDAGQGTSLAVAGIAEDRRTWGYVATGPDGQITSRVDLPRRRDPFGQPQMSPHLPEGEHVFVVERRPAEMAMWLEARPDFVATAPARQDESLQLQFLAKLNRVLYEKA